MVNRYLHTLDQWGCHILEMLYLAGILVDRNKQEALVYIYIYNLALLAFLPNVSGLNIVDWDLFNLYCAHKSP